MKIITISIFKLSLFVLFSCALSINSQIKAENFSEENSFNTIISEYQNKPIDQLKFCNELLKIIKKSRNEIYRNEATRLLISLDSDILLPSCIRFLQKLVEKEAILKRQKASVRDFVFLYEQQTAILKVFSRHTWNNSKFRTSTLSALEKLSPSFKGTRYLYALRAISAAVNVNSMKYLIKFYPSLRVYDLNPFMIINGIGKQLQKNPDPNTEKLYALFLVNEILAKENSIQLRTKTIFYNELTRLKGKTLLENIQSINNKPLRIKLEQKYNKQRSYLLFVLSNSKAMLKKDFWKIFRNLKNSLRLYTLPEHWYKRIVIEYQKLDKINQKTHYSLMQILKQSSGKSPALKFIKEAKKLKLPHKWEALPKIERPEKLNEIQKTILWINKLNKTSLSKSDKAFLKEIFQFPLYWFATKNLPGDIKADSPIAILLIQSEPTYSMVLSDNKFRIFTSKVYEALAEENVLKAKLLLYLSFVNPNNGARELVTNTLKHPKFLLNFTQELRTQKIKLSKKSLSVFHNIFQDLFKNKDSEVLSAAINSYPHYTNITNNAYFKIIIKAALTSKSPTVRSAALNQFKYWKNDPELSIILKLFIEKENTNIIQLQAKTILESWNRLSKKSSITKIDEKYLIKKAKLYGKIKSYRILETHAIFIFINKAPMLYITSAKYFHRYQNGIYSEKKVVPTVTKVIGTEKSLILLTNKGIAAFDLLQNKETLFTFDKELILGDIEKVEFLIIKKSKKETLFLLDTFGQSIYLTYDKTKLKWVQFKLPE